MQPLDDPQHEKFAQFRAQGMSQAKAYEMAGYRPHGGNANRLSNKESVISRVQELVEAGAKRAQMDVAWAMQRMHDLSLASESLGDIPAAIVAHDKLCKMLGAYNEGGGSSEPQALSARAMEVIDSLDLDDIRAAKQLPGGDDGV